MFFLLQAEKAAPYTPRTHHPPKLPEFNPPPTNPPP